MSGEQVEKHAQRRDISGAWDGWPGEGEKEKQALVELWTRERKARLRKAASDFDAYAYMRCTQIDDEMSV